MHQGTERGDGGGWSALLTDEQQIDEAGNAAAAGRWCEAYDRLHGLDPATLEPAGLELLADCAWWRSRVDEEIELRRRAHAGYVEAGDRRRAAYTAWMLGVRFGLRGQHPVAAGWLHRARRLLTDEPEGVEHGYVACSEAERALADGRVDDAESSAGDAVRIGETFGERELVALGVSWQGLARIARGEVEAGTALLDEAMSAVVAGELDAHFTGWIYCFAIGMCMGVADLPRAAAWTDAAAQWCGTLTEATPYHGLCRVRQVEVMCLRGDLATAEADARRACDEMMTFEPHLAGEAFYAAGEILRRRGDLAGAEAAFDRARELGTDPQPGVALIRLAEGRTEAAAAALRAALADGGRSPLERAALLAAQVDVALTTADHATAAGACDQLDALAGELPSSYLDARAATSRGGLHVAAGRPEAAVTDLRRAIRLWRALDARAEAAHARTFLGRAMRQLGDDEGAAHELEAARRELVALGAPEPSSAAARDIAAPSARPLGISERECEVLGLVASGRTNRQIADELVLSEHTIARHLSNIFTKLGVTSRTAAAAYAFEHGLAGRPATSPDRADGRS